MTVPFSRLRFVRACVLAAVVSILASATAMLRAEPVAVRHVEGIVHGFLELRTLEGETIANGDLIQLARGSRVTSRLTFHFRDGSLHDETAVFSQGKQFRLLSDRLVQKGPSFPHPMDVSIDAANGVVTVHYSEDGTQKDTSKRLSLPPDVANGLILTLLKNVAPDATPKSFSFVAATPAPRVVKLMISNAGKERFSTGGETREATHYVLKVDIGGLKGVLAPLVGKQPPDSHVWILGGDAPAFVRSEQQLYFGGPVWRIDIVAPAFHKASGK